MPDPANPQSLNRYAYALNQPLRFVDPSGHAWIDASEGAGASGTGSWAGALASAARTGQEYSEIRTLLVTAALTVGIGGFVLPKLVELVAGAVSPVVAEAAAGAATAACADGDCTNEVTTASRGVSSLGQATSNAAQSVWRMNPLARGAEIEVRLGGRSPQLPYNFPGIDRFDNGVATSIKSIDLGTKTYQDIGSLTSKVQGYVNELANWQGASWPSASVLPSQITSRELLLAIPTGATAEQMAALQQLQQWAQTVGVTLNTAVIP